MRLESVAARLLLLVTLTVSDWDLFGEPEVPLQLIETAVSRFWNVLLSQLLRGTLTIAQVGLD